MKIFITGASGFVGGHLTEALSKSHEVFAMARSDKSAAQVESYGARAVRCDLDSIQPAHLQGIEAVIHCAAYVEEWGTREQFWRGNVEGTERMLVTAREARVRRFVHIGTEAALFSGLDLLQIDEAFPYPERHQFLYSETKAEAERRVLAANSSSMTTLSIRPRLVWGPRDTSVLPAVLRMAKSGAWSWMEHGAKMTSTTHIKNLVHAVECALTKGNGGQAYFVSDGEDRTMREFLSALVKTQGVQLSERNTPKAIARAAATTIEGIWRLFGLKKAPPMTRFAVYMMSSAVTVKIDKARQELGYQPVITVADGLKEIPQA
jgi:nucleoside-diphosphate-sugar epimerase